MFAGLSMLPPGPRRGKIVLAEAGQRRTMGGLEKVGKRQKGGVLGQGWAVGPGTCTCYKS